MFPPAAPMMATDATSPQALATTTVSGLPPAASQSAAVLVADARIVVPQGGLVFEFLPSALNAAHPDDPTKWRFYLVPSLVKLRRKHEDGQSVFTTPSSSSSSSSSSPTSSSSSAPPTSSRSTGQQTMTSSGLIDVAQLRPRVLTVQEPLWADFIRVGIFAIFDPLELRTMALAALRTVIPSEQAALIDQTNIESLRVERIDWATEFQHALLQSLGVTMRSSTVPALTPGTQLSLDFVVRGQYLAAEMEKGLDDQQKIPLLARMTMLARSIPDAIIHDALMSARKEVQEKNQLVVKTSHLLSSPAMRSLFSSKNMTGMGISGLIRSEDERPLFLAQLHRLIMGFHQALELEMRELYSRGGGENVDRAVREAGGKIDELALRFVLSRSRRTPLYPASSSSNFFSGSPTLLLQGVDVSAGQLSRELNELFVASRSVPGSYRFNRYAMNWTPGFHVWGFDAAFLQQAAVADKRWTKEELQKELREQCGISIECLGAYIMVTQLEVIVVSRSALRQSTLNPTDSDPVIARVQPKNRPTNASTTAAVDPRRLQQIIEQLAPEGTTSDRITRAVHLIDALPPVALHLDRRNPTSHGLIAKEEQVTAAKEERKSTPEEDMESEAEVSVGMPEMLSEGGTSSADNSAASETENENLRRQLAELRAEVERMRRDNSQKEAALANMDRNRS